MLHARLLFLLLSLDAVCQGQTFDARGITSSGGHGTHERGTLSYSIGQASGATYTASTAVVTAGVQQPVRIMLPLNIRAFLSGPYDADNGLMWDSLRTAGLIPVQEPYTGSGYVHTGIGGGEELLPEALYTSGTDAIVDWVLVELRDANDASRVVSTRCGFVQRDGDVVSADGASPIQLSAIPGTYHLALHHRNHLPVITSSPLALGMGATVDIASGAVPLEGAEPQKMNGTERSLWPGDVNGDHSIRYTGADNDRDLILQEVGGLVPTSVVVGYLNSDVNMDGRAKYTGSGNDRDPILVTIGGVVPTAVRTLQMP